VVYGLLSDLSTHMEWGGSWHPTRTQRLLSMESPKGPATVGVEFASTGSAGGGCWYDRSRVTAATSPTVFEFETRGQLRDGHGHAGAARGRWRPPPAPAGGDLQPGRPVGDRAWHPEPGPHGRGASGPRFSRGGARGPGRAAAGGSLMSRWDDSVTETAEDAK